MLGTRKAHRNRRGRREGARRKGEASSGLAGSRAGNEVLFTWVVLKVMVPFGVLSIVQHLVLREPKRGPEF